LALRAECLLREMPLNVLTGRFLSPPPSPSCIRAAAFFSEAQRKRKSARRPSGPSLSFRRPARTVQVQSVFYGSMPSSLSLFELGKWTNAYVRWMYKRPPLCIVPLQLQETSQGQQKQPTKFPSKSDRYQEMTHLIISRSFRQRSPRAVKFFSREMSQTPSPLSKRCSFKCVKRVFQAAAVVLRRRGTYGPLFTSAPKSRRASFF